MTESIEAIINPELLVWARKSAGLKLADAAKKAQVSEDKLNEWETGKSTLSVSQLRRLAKIYKRPMAVFYLPEPSVTFDAIRDYRIIYGSQTKELSPHLLLEIRRARYRREIALEISELLGESIKPFNEKLSIDDEPDNLSEYIRELLGISMEEQSKWKDSHKAFNRWKDAVERLDIIVFQTASTCKIGLKEMRGFSISENALPVIVINSKDQPNGKIFTLIHEFAHILLHNGGICDLNEPINTYNNDDMSIETFCNQVTASVLVPKNDILKHKIVIENEGVMIWDDQKIKVLASFFSVSQEAILRRLLTLNRTNIDFYRKKRSEYTERYEKIVLEKQEDKPESHTQYYRLIIRNNGLSYTKLILNAYNQSVITSSEVSDYLGVNLKHLNKIEQAIMSSPVV
jgi:Zn-dependent peptidase ImmA (M78 family)/DNA-binding XRE family transcriptional regulator